MYLKWIYRRIRRFYQISKVKLENNISDCLDNQVLFLVHSAKTGGAPVLAMHILLELKKNGYSPVIVIMEPGELLENFLEIAPVVMPRSKNELRKFLNNNKIENGKVCICNGVLTGVYVPILKEYGYSILSLLHELPNTIEANCAKRRLENIIEKSDAVVFPSTIVRDRCFRYIDKKIFDQIYVKPQGLFLTKPQKVNKDEMKRKYAVEWGLDLDHKIVLNVASTNYRKGFDLFLDAALLDDEKTFVWVGLQENSFYKSCCAKHNDTMPTNLITFGYINNPDKLSQLYAMADVFALTSREEPFGSVVLEAFSYGTPVVAFDNCGGYVDVVENDITGMLVKKISGASIVCGINHVLKDSERYEWMSNNCYEKSVAMNFEEYVSFLEKVGKLENAKNEK